MAVIPSWWKAEWCCHTLHLLCSLHLHTCALPDNLFKNVVRGSRCQCRFVELILRRCGCRWSPRPFVLLIHQMTVEAKQEEHVSVLLANIQYQQWWQSQDKLHSGAAENTPSSSSFLYQRWSVQVRNDFDICFPAGSCDSIGCTESCGRANWFRLVGDKWDICLLLLIPTLTGFSHNVIFSVASFLVSFSPLKLPLV